MIPGPLSEFDSFLRPYFILNFSLIFLALIGSSLPAILLQSFHRWLLYYTCIADVDKNAPTPYSIHNLDFHLRLLFPFFSHYFFPFSLFLTYTAKYRLSHCITYRLISVFSRFFFFFFLGYSIIRIHCTFLSGSFSILLFAMYSTISKMEAFWLDSLNNLIGIL